MHRRLFMFLPFLATAAQAHSLKVEGLAFQPLQPAFPALTCPAQAAFRTASPASAHGMVANGLYFRELRRPMFWEQSASQVRGERIWSRFRARGGRVGLAFWQQSLGELAAISRDLC